MKEGHRVPDSEQLHGAADSQGWFAYDPLRINCQKFVGYVLQGCGGCTPAGKTFSLQDITELIKKQPSHLERVKKQPSHLERVARTATDLGAIGERIVNGAGLHRGITLRVIRELH